MANIGELVASLGLDIKDFTKKFQVVDKTVEKSRKETERETKVPFITDVEDESAKKILKG